MEGRYYENLLPSLASLPRHAHDQCWCLCPGRAGVCACLPFPSYLTHSLPHSLPVCQPVFPLSLTPFHSFLLFPLEPASSFPTLSSSLPHSSVSPSLSLLPAVLSYSCSTTSSPSLSPTLSCLPVSLTVFTSHSHPSRSGFFSPLLARLRLFSEPRPSAYIRSVTNLPQSPF